jgi:hypothetical protein
MLIAVRTQTQAHYRERVLAAVSGAGFGFRLMTFDDAILHDLPWLWRVNITMPNHLLST